MAAHTTRNLTMKKLLLSLVLAASPAAQAAGTHDGLYHCTIRITNITGLSDTLTRYFSLHTRTSDNIGVFVVAADTARAGYGYVIGTIVGDQFSGTDDDGYPFSATLGTSMTAAQSATTITGTRTAQYSCFKFF